MWRHWLFSQQNIIPQPYYSRKLKTEKQFVFSFISRYKGASGSSAVCAFTMAQVERAFSGRYREVNRETQQWYTYNHPVPEPRPGGVSGASNILWQTAQFNVFWLGMGICSVSVLVQHWTPCSVRGVQQMKIVFNCTERTSPTLHQAASVHWSLCVWS